MGRVFQDVSRGAGGESDLAFEIEELSGEERREALAQSFGGGSTGYAAADGIMRQERAADMAVDSEDIIDTNKASKSVSCPGGSQQLSRHFTVKSLCPSVPLPNSKTVRVAGKTMTLTGADLACNLKHLAVNTLDPLVDWLKTKGYGYRIGSGYRSGSDGSYHNSGSAVDIYITKGGKLVSRETLRQTVKEFIEKGVAPFHQVLLEYSDPSSLGWFHVANCRLGATPKAHRLGYSFNNGADLHQGFPNKA